MYKVQTTIIFDLICFVFLRQLINRHHGAICQFPSSVLANVMAVAFSPNPCEPVRATLVTSGESPNQFK